MKTWSLAAPNRSDIDKSAAMATDDHGELVSITEL